MSFQLRPYQEAIIQEARGYMAQGVRKILIQSATGSGKTCLTAKMIGTAAQKGMNAWFIVHRRELINQSSEAFSKAEVAHGIVSSGFHPNPFAKVQICNVASLRSRHSDMRKPSLIVWDECHHQTAGTWDKIFKAYPDSYHVGLTATPQRLDGTGLNQHYSVMINGPNVRSLIDNGYLSNYKLFAPPTVSLAGVHARMGDFVKSELQELMDKPTITGNAINEYSRRANNLRAIVFAVSIKHSEHIAEQFQKRGITAAHIDGSTPQAQRDYLIEEFRRGRIKVLSNVDLFGEGFDVPALDAIIMLRPTQSLGLYLQMVGRALRVSPGKSHAIILDHVGNCERHGLPDQEREWTLAGRIKKRSQRADSVSVRICEACFAAMPITENVCQFCGYLFPVKEREIEHVDGDLVEIDPTQTREVRHQEQRRASSFEDLVELGKSRGYKRPYHWAKHIMNARQRRKIRGG